MKRLLKYLMIIILPLVWCCKGPDKPSDSIEVKWSLGPLDSIEGIPSRLSGFGLFKEPLSAMKPQESIFLYEVNAPLFSDYAGKKRFVYLPEGTAIEYQEDEVFDFPDGTMIFKFFYYENVLESGESQTELVETRVLVKRNGLWEAYPYVWDFEQKDALLQVAGFDRNVQWQRSQDQSLAISYLVPNMNQCKSCHEHKQQLVPIGLTARQLNRHNPVLGDNQLNWLVKQGWLKHAENPSEWPALANWEDVSAGLDQRARAYLESNCAHCHRPQGPARNSALNLLASETNKAALGVGKTPIAAGKGSGGLKFDIVPGAPEQSIMVYRMQSAEPGVMMPEIGRQLVHHEGVALISDWIRSLKD